MTYIYGRGFGYGQPVVAAPRAVFRLENCDAGCPPHAANQCRAIVQRAANTAIRLCRDAAAKLEAVPRAASTDAAFIRFFGHPPTRPVPWANNQPSGLSVAHRLRKVADALEKRVVHFRCFACAANAAVWTRPANDAQRNEVLLCGGFWAPVMTPPGTADDIRFTRAAIIIHEMLHLLYRPFFLHRGDAPDLDPQERRRDNSHCYEALALALAGRRIDPIDITNCGNRGF